MRRAGEAVARRTEQLTRPGDLILIMAGKGHNGDDACFAGEYMGGRETHIERVSDPVETQRKLAALLERRPAFIIDGLFGIGLNRPLSSQWSGFIDQLNLCHIPILSVDVPSGLNADTGEVLENAIRANHTITLGAVKTGLTRATSWSYAGRVEVATEIGLIPYPFTTEINWTIADDFSQFPPPRPVAGHKGTFGHLVIIAGSQGYHGAAVLAARGAQRAQPGLITVITLDNAYLPVASQLQSVMVRPWKSELSIPNHATALAVGPGLAADDVPQTLRGTVARLWREGAVPMVVDASALAWLKSEPVTTRALRVVTPHPGEAASLLGSSVPKVLEDRAAALREISQKFGRSYVVLKGHQTLIGRAKEELYINSSGNPYLAQGGSGDLLTGFLGGLMAQGHLLAQPLDLLRYGVWQHGATADLLQISRPGWSVENLADQLSTVRPRSRH